MSIMRSLSPSSNLKSGWDSAPLREEDLRRRLRQRRIGKPVGLVVTAAALAGCAVLALSWAGASDKAQVALAPTVTPAPAKVVAPPADDRSKPSLMGAALPLLGTAEAEPASPPQVTSQPEVAQKQADEPVNTAALTSAPVMEGSPAQAETAPAAVAEPPRPSSPALALPPRPMVSSEEAAKLVDLARARIRQGDIAGARRLLERAVQAEDRDAMVALAETYDPVVLKRWGVVGVKADPRQAQALYERAAAHGGGPGEPMLAMTPSKRTGAKP